MLSDFYSLDQSLVISKVLEDRLGRCHRFTTQWLHTSETNHWISSFNELGGGFSWFNYSEGVDIQCRALDIAMWSMIPHSDVVAGKSTLPD